MSSPSKPVELLGWIAFEGARLRPFLPTYLHLIASALFPIYVGAHASVSAPSSAKLPSKKEKAAQDEELSGEASELTADRVEGLTPKDAVLFPLLAGATLSSLYFIIRWLEDPSILNKVLNYYFMQAGLFFGTKFLKDAFTVIRSVLLPSQYSHQGRVWRAERAARRYDAVGMKPAAQEAHRSSPLPGRLHRLPLPRMLSDGIWAIRRLLYARCTLNFHIHKLVNLKMPVDMLDAIAICTSLGITGVFTFFYKPWYVSNLIGFAFCYGSTQFMSPTTFWTGTLLLGALFCYDIYFVFYTPIMVTVATKLDVPIKLLFPRPPSASETEKGLQGLAMLGLGDIVIPGMMIALALRFDLYLHYLKMSKTTDGKTQKAVYRPASGGWGERFWVGKSAAGPDLEAKSFPKPYFKAGTTGYSLGMVVTLVMMQISDRPQPALLYLVPGVLGALWGTAALKGDLGQMWKYSEQKEAERPQKSSKRIKGERSAIAGEERKDNEKEAAEDANGELATKNDVSTAQTDESLSHLSTKDETPAEPSDDHSNSESISESLPDSHASTDPAPRPSDGVSQKAKAKKSSHQEDKTRHLIWFSIDFPPPRPRPAPDSANENENDTENKQKQPIDTSSSARHHEEPPGKRRRMR